jgi:hypothetical protein
MTPDEPRSTDDSMSPDSPDDSRCTPTASDPGRLEFDPGKPEFDPDAVAVPITDALDLHAFHPRDILRAVADYLEEAAAGGFTEVRLIHGKGMGFQRERVQSLLATHPRVESYRDAPPERGHWGATLVRLRRPDQEK